MRNITPAMDAALAARGVRPRLLFEGDFVSGSVHVWTGLGDLDWGGQTWTGLGTLIGISEIEESPDVVAQSITVTLAGVDQLTVALAIVDASQGLPGRAWLALVAADGTVISDPVLAFAGRLDVPIIDDGADTCTISITYESRFVDPNRSRDWRYTHESQQALYPGDRGFEYVTTLQNKKITWGQG